MAALFRFTVEHYLSIPLGVLAGLLWANTSGESYFQFSHAAAFPVNSVGMTIFFAIVAQELLEAGMPGGVLHPWHRAALPLVAAAGGLLGSAATFAAWLEYVDERMLMQAWPAACAIDLVLSYFVARAVFADRASVAFVLLIAVATDIAVFLVAGITWSGTAASKLGGIVALCAAVGTAFLLMRRHETRLAPYILGCGALCWSGLFLVGIHPALALVPIVPFMVRTKRRSNVFETPIVGERGHPASHLETALRYPVQVVLFFFTLTNGGVVLQHFDPGAWAVTVAALFGRPTGILLAVGIAISLGMRRPAGSDWRHMVAAALTASVGFSFSLFVAAAILPTGALLTETKAGAVGTALGIPLAIAAAFVLRVGKPGRRVPGPSTARGSTQST